MKPTLTLVRGLPGSGKTTFAQSLPGEHFEADRYFVDEEGNYKFNPFRLRSAHEWCRTQAFQALKKRKDVVVSNPFTTFWEMVPYIVLANKMGAVLRIYETTGQYGSTHGVPEETILKLEEKWEPYGHVQSRI